MTVVDLSMIPNYGIFAYEMDEKNRNCIKENRDVPAVI